MEHGRKLGLDPVKCRCSSRQDESPDSRAEEALDMHTLSAFNFHSINQAYEIDLVSFIQPSDLILWHEV